MKPLTIEELKALPVGEWVWVVIKIENEVCQQYRDKYYMKLDNKYKLSSEETLCCGTVKSELRAELEYAYYGKTWVAYKNKEQAEVKEQCVICHKDVSNELPKIDTYGNRYCKECYQHKSALELAKSKADEIGKEAMSELEEKAVEDIEYELEVSKQFPYLHKPREVAKRLVYGCGYGKVKEYQDEIMDLTAKLEATKQDKENLKRTIEEMNEALEASGISIDVDGDVVYENVKQAVRAFAEKVFNCLKGYNLSYFDGENVRPFDEYKIARIIYGIKKEVCGE